MTTKKIISDYKILTAGSNVDLSTLVNEHIEDGWQPWGNLVVTPGTYGIHYFQVMIQESTPDLRGAWG